MFGWEAFQLSCQYSFSLERVTRQPTVTSPGTAKIYEVSYIYVYIYELFGLGWFIMYVQILSYITIPIGDEWWFSMLLKLKAWNSFVPPYDAVVPDTGSGLSVRRLLFFIIFR